MFKQNMHPDDQWPDQLQYFMTNIILCYRSLFKRFSHIYHIHQSSGSLKIPDPLLDKFRKSGFSEKLIGALAVQVTCFAFCNSIMICIWITLNSIVSDT